MTTADNGKYACPSCGGWYYNERCYDECGGVPECNGICLYGADLGVPEYGDVAYAHPDCELHGDPLEEHDDADVCDAGGYEWLRYVREDDLELERG